jgi:hypothetical protein
MGILELYSFDLLTTQIHWSTKKMLMTRRVNECQELRLDVVVSLAIESGVGC